MIGNPLDVRQRQEIAQREQIRATPREAPLAVDPLEVADHVHPEVPPRRKRRRAHPRRVIRPAHSFNERVKSGFPKQILQAIVERVSRRADAARASDLVSEPGSGVQEPLWAPALNATSAERRQSSGALRFGAGPKKLPRRGYQGFFYWQSLIDDVNKKIAANLAYL